jgi:transposase
MRKINGPTNPKLVLAIVKMRENTGATYRELAEEFGLSHMTCFTIVRAWRAWGIEELQRRRQASL